MIEVLLVVVVIGIILTIAMPSFVRSMQGQRLRAAARTMTTVSRYARSMAVIKQSDLKLVFNLVNGQVDLLSSNAAVPRFTRTIEGVRLVEVAIEGQDPVTDGSCAVPFGRNGLCAPFKAKIADRHGSHIYIKVDALGRIKTTMSGAE